MGESQDFRPGELVYMIIRNPHAQGVAHIQQAAIVENPDNPDELALFAHENYFPLSEEFALFKSEEEAEAAYQEAFGTVDIEDVHYDG